MAVAIHPAVDMSKLHPDIAGFLAKLNALTPVDPARVAVADRRKMFATFAGSSNGELDFIPRVEDRMVPVGAGGERHLRLFYPTVPAGTGSALPAFLYLHGGGWHAGSITTHDPICRRLALASGCVVASLDYRMAPEHVAPAAIDDCVGAWHWLHSHAAELGLQQDKIGLAGDSAGANVVTSAAVRMCSPPDAAGSAAASADSAAAGAGAAPAATAAATAAGAGKPAALALIYPSLDLTASSGPSYEHYAEGFYLRLASIHHYVELYLHGASSAGAGSIEPSDPLVSPLLAPAEHLERLPPTFISTAGYDPLRSDGDAFARRLEAGRVPVSLMCEEDAIHAWMHLAAQLGPEGMAARMRALGGHMRKLLVA